MAKKIVRDDVKKLLGVEKALTETCEEFTVFGASKYGGLISISKTHGEKPVEQIRNLEHLLLSGIVNVIGEPNKDGKKTKMKITQGKLDLAMLITLDLVQMLLNLGAEDYASIEERVCDEDSCSWVDEEDIFEAYNDEEDVLEDKIEEIEKVRRAKAEEVLSEVFDIPREDIAKMLDGKYNKKGTIAVKKLSQEQVDKLKTVLDEVEDEED